MSKRPSRGVSSGVGFPTRMTGRDGDLTIRKTKEGKILYVKEHGKWHPINTGVDVAQMKKDVDRLIRSVNTLRNDNNPYPTINALNIRKNVATDTVDPKITFTVAGTDIFTMGVDTNDSNSFVLAQSSALGTTNKLTMTTAGAVTLASALGVASGGTGIDASSETGVLVVDSGTVSVEAALGGDKGGIDVTNNADDRIMTGSGTEGQISGEDYLTYNATDGMTIRSGVTFENNANTEIKQQATAHNVAGKTVTNTTAGTIDDIAGGNLTLVGGLGKGTGVGGDIAFRVSPAGSSGDTLNPALPIMTLRGDYKVVDMVSSPVGFTQKEATYNVDDTNIYFSLYGNKQYVELTDTPTVDLHLYFPDVSGNFVLLVKQDSTGTRLITNYRTWDQADGNESTVVFAGGSNPTLTTTGNKIDIFSFYWDNTNHKAYGTITHNF